MFVKSILSLLALSVLSIAGCGGHVTSAVATEPSAKQVKLAAKGTPSFTLWWSEYPSWSKFGVADKLGLINGKKGVLGPIEQKYNVDIVLKQADYEPCITAFGNGQAEGVCITNMDILSPCLSRPSVAILPTSTSYGADAIIVNNDIKSIADLKGKHVYGLEKSVSEYLFARVLAQAGMKEGDVNFKQQDPGAAAQAMQTGQKGYDAIVVWEPFVMQTLKTRKGSVHVLADSTKIKGEIIDMVVVGADTLAKPGGEDFAHAIIATCYEVDKWLADVKTSDKAHVELGKKFSNLDADQMREVLKRCRLFSTADQGMSVFTDPKLPDVMKQVVDFSVDRKIVEKAPVISYSVGNKPSPVQANLIFTPRFMSGYDGKK